MSGFDLGPIRLASCWHPLLHPIVRELAFPRLPDIDCHNCRMVRMGLFADHIRCCDYVPPLPNFLVGEILTDGQRSGSRQQVRQWVREGRGGPLFLNVPPRLIELHRQNRLPCPLLDAHMHCSIYEHRPYLCVGYNCTYPNDPRVPGLWNSISSLLALHSAIAAQFLLLETGIDGNRFTDAWDTAGANPWTQDDAIGRELHAELWQGHEPESHYRRCYEHILMRGDAIHSDLEQYRRAQLIRHGQRSEAELAALPTEPEPREPPAILRQALEKRIVVFAEHSWTAVEHESFLLWYAQQ